MFYLSKFLCTINLLIISLVVCFSMSEMIIKESKVDPFLLILDNQRNLMEKMDIISTKLNAFNDLKLQVTSLEKDLKQSDASFKSLQSNFNQLNDKVASLSSKMFKTETSRSEFEKELRFVLGDLTDETKELFTVCNSSTAREAEKEIVTKKSPRDTHIFYRENDEYLSASHNYRVLDTKINKTHEQLFRILSLLHNIEYRQHISSLAQDGRLNALIQKMAFHEHKLINQIEDQVLNVRNRLERKIDSFAANFDQNSSLSRLKEEQHLIRSSNETEDYIDCGNDCVSNSTQETITNYSTEPRIISNSSSTQVTSNTHSPVPLTTEANTTESISNFSESADEDVIIESSTPSFALPTLESLSQIFERDESIEEKTVAQTVEQPLLIRNVKKLLDEQISKIELLLQNRISITEDRLQGVRIHQSSAFYSHAKEMRYELEKLQRGLSETIQTSNIKLSKKLDNTKNALYRFIDGAVTSISSAAVTSVQSTGIQVTQQFQKSMKELRERLLEMTTNSTTNCPDFYQKIGQTCHADLRELEITWRESCLFCRTISGTLISGLNIEMLREIQGRNQTKTSKYFWLGRSEQNFCNEYNQEDKEELTNSVLTTDGLRNDTILQCPSVNLSSNLIEITLFPCSKKLGTVCQYQPKYNQQRSEVYNDD